MDRQPAPGALALVQDFCNSLRTGAADGAADRQALTEWMEFYGFAIGAPVPAADIAAARRLADLLRDALIGDPEDERQVRARAELDRLARRWPLVVRVGAGFEAAPEATGPAAVPGTLLAALIRAEADGTLRRLKICSDESCRWVYYDHSRNGSARWCSMRLCGSRDKNRAYRRRRSESTVR